MRKHPPPSPPPIAMNLQAAGMKFVVLVELPIYENILRLASGYIQAMTQPPPIIGATYIFEIVSLPMSAPSGAILAQLLFRDADGCTITGCTWNMALGVIHRLRPEGQKIGVRSLRDRELLTHTEDPQDDHRARQMIPYMSHRGLEHNAADCQGMGLRFREVLPNWTTVSVTPQFRG